MAFDFVSLAIDLGADEARGESGVPISAQLEHVASFGGFKSAPTYANTVVTAALFVEMRRVGGSRPRHGWRPKVHRYNTKVTGAQLKLAATTSKSWNMFIFP
jgi:hypothetical protein